MYDPSEVKVWIERAEHDFADATAFLRRRESFFLNMVCFHCQQTAEKYLKALLVFHETPFPKVHNLLRLLRLCAKFAPALKSHQDSFALLNPYTVHFEKPGEEAEAKLAWETVKNIRTALRGCFPAELLKPSGNKDSNHDRA
jgi:HEPN domain-containing protein